MKIIYSPSVNVEDKYNKRCTPWVLFAISSNRRHRSDVSIVTTPLEYNYTHVPQLSKAVINFERKFFHLSNHSNKAIVNMHAISSNSSNRSDCPHSRPFSPAKIPPHLWIGWRADSCASISLAGAVFRHKLALGDLALIFSSSIPPKSARSAAWRNGRGCRAAAPLRPRGDGRREMRVFSLSVDFIFFSWLKNKIVLLAMPCEWISGLMWD